MALYFTFYLECYCEKDAARIAERLKSSETRMDSVISEKSRSRSLIQR